jgi:hypothetical protein
MTTALLDPPSATSADLHLLAGADIVLADGALPLDVLARAVDGTAFRVDSVQRAHATSTVRVVSPLAIGWSNVADLQRRLAALADVVSVTRVRRIDLVDVVATTA